MLYAPYRIIKARCVDRVCNKDGIVLSSIQSFIEKSSQCEKWWLIGMNFTSGMIQKNSIWFIEHFIKNTGLSYKIQNKWIKYVFILDQILFAETPPPPRFLLMDHIVVKPFNVQ